MKFLNAACHGDKTIMRKKSLRNKMTYALCVCAISMVTTICYPNLYYSYPKLVMDTYA